MNDTFLRMF